MCNFIINVRYFLVLPFFINFSVFKEIEMSTLFAEKQLTFKLDFFLVFFVLFFGLLVLQCYGAS